MMQYVDQHGQNISLGRKLGTGGEGAVFEISNSSDYVAKIYHKAATNEKAAKLAAMVQLATKEIVAFAAWPAGTLHERRGGTTLGILIPRVKHSHEIHELYSPAHRKARFPRADWRFLVRTARNCAAAFATLHEHNIVIGDVNQGNLFVSQEATVSLIDCDSFQLSANGRMFRCPVGVAHFVPPELQQTRLSDVIRTANHDNFGLAIVIFHLLFMGRHPFAGRYSGLGDMPIETAIREFRFAYSSSAARFQMAPPPHSVTLAHLPQDLAVLFERAFARGSERANARPTPHVWASTLDQFERNLCQCDQDSGHFFSSLLLDCPWCDIIRTGGPNFFISVTMQSVVDRSALFDLAGIWAQIQSVPRPDSSFKPAPRYATDHLRPRPLPASATENLPSQNVVGIIAAVGGGL
ncbi:MAG: hypothetical protein KDA81_15960, partial [Planctomycetaceae bacterium]|nr:hypothetical protein [Planctomycetaceae bacterium]